MDPFQVYCSKTVRRVVGLMSGTSADGIDAVLVALQGVGAETHVVVQRFQTFPFPAKVRSALFSMFQGRGGGLRSVARMHALLGELFAEAALEISGGSVDLVASHGQTVFHQPQPRRYLGRPVSSTYQIGDGCIIAARVGCCVVSDFRVADLARGGQGAPLVPYADWVLFTHPSLSRVALNIGGIANLTYLPASASLEEVLAFDTGPGNALLDAAMRLISGGRQQLDEGGRLAASGTVRRDLLTAWLSHPYFALPPPKSTGRELFGEPYARALLAQFPDVPTGDMLATLTALTARSIADAIDTLPAVDEAFLGGGGAHNATLVAMLTAALPSLRVRPMEEAGVSADAREAVAFAIMANETMHGLASNVPTATGASRRAILGKISLPS